MAKAKSTIPGLIFSFVETGVWAVVVVEVTYRLCLMQLEGIATVAAGALAIEVAITSLIFNRARAHKEGSDSQKISLEAGELSLLSTVLLVFAVAVGAGGYTLLMRFGYVRVEDFNKLDKFAPMAMAFLPMFAVSIGFFFFSRALKMIVIDCLPPALRFR